MKISFNNPIFMALIPVVVSFIVLMGIRMKSYGSIKKAIFITVRSVLSILLILALSGMNIFKTADTVTTIFCADLSASSREYVYNSKDFFDKSQKNIRENMLFGAVAFGTNAVLEKSVDENIFNWNFSSYIDDSATNIEESLKIASTVFDDDTSKRIVLVSDGSENMGDAIKQASVLKSKNIVVDAYIPKKDTGEEVQVTSIDVDKYINKNVWYDVGIVVDSTVNTTGVLRLYKDSSLVYNENVSITSGNNRFVIRDISEKGGNVVYRATIEPLEDTYTENNQIYESCYIDDVPYVMVIENNDSGREMKKLLEASKVNVVGVDANSSPTTVEQLDKYDAVVISDVNIDDLSQEFLQALDLYVKNLGGGLLVTAGENSLALGGYFNTPLENMLPINMQIKTEGENPNLGMIFVIDNSGSMDSANYGVSRMEMAKEAVIRSIDNLNPNDVVGVLSFDSTPTWVFEPALVGENSEAIKTEVAKMQPEGGTSILPALSEAGKKMEDVDAKIKHIVLLTDGQAETQGYENVISGMKDAGITLSTVAVGNGADTSLLKSLADKSNGRYYFTNEFTDLPKIFANETLLAGKDYINNREFFPKSSDYSDILSNISDTPMISGYISSSLKQGADLVLSTDEDEPLLATWQYGIGRTAVWTSDMNGRWTDSWLSSDSGTNIIKNTVSWVMKQKISEDISASANVLGGKSKIIIESDSSSNIKSMKGTVISFDNNEYSVDFKNVSSGVFEGELSDTREGAYIVNLDIVYSDGKSENINTSFNIHYPIEYDITKNRDGENTIKKIVEITGGKIIENPEDIYSYDMNNVLSETNLDSFLIFSSIVLLLFDIFIRRFSFVSDKIEKFIVNILGYKKIFKDMDKKVTVKKKDNPKVKPNKEVKDTSSVGSVANNTASTLLNNKKKRNR